MADEQPPAAKTAEKPPRPALKFPRSFVDAHNFPVLPTLPKNYKPGSLVLPPPRPMSNSMAFPAPASGSNPLALPRASQSNTLALPVPGSRANPLDLSGPASMPNQMAFPTPASGSNPLALSPPAYGSNAYEFNAYGSNASGPSAYGSNTYGSNAYSSNASGPSAYGSNAYSSNASGPSAYGSNASGPNAYGSNSLASPTASRSNTLAFPAPASDSSPLALPAPTSGSNPLSLSAPASMPNSMAFPAPASGSNPLALPAPASGSNESRSNSLAFPALASGSNAYASNTLALPTPASGSSAYASNTLALPTPASGSNAYASNTLALPTPASDSNPLALPTPDSGSNPPAFPEPGSESNPLDLTDSASESTVSGPNSLALSAPAPKPKLAGARPTGSKPSGVSKRRHPPRRMTMNPAMLPPVDEGQDEQSPNIWSSAPNCTMWPTSKARTYNQDTLNQFLVASQDPEPWKLNKAAEIILEHLDDVHFRFAFMGGYSLYLRGSPRVPKDLDITVGESSVHKVIAALRRCANLCIPDPVLLASRTTVFINPLPWMYPPPLVRMDIVISGYFSMPYTLKRFSERVVPRHGWYSKVKLPPVVVVACMVRAKLHAHYDRKKYTSNDFKDLFWLIQNCTDEVHRGLLYNVYHYEEFSATAYARGEDWGNRAADVLKFTRPSWSEAFDAKVKEARALLQLEDAIMF